MLLTECLATCLRRLFLSEKYLGPPRKCTLNELGCNLAQDEFCLMLFESTRKSKSTMKQCVLDYATADRICYHNYLTDGPFHLSYFTTPKGSCCNAWKTRCSNDVPNSTNRFYEIFLITYIPYVALFPHESLRC